jgi:hypothetical protein
MIARLLSTVLFACICAVSVGVSDVQAASGRISFSGAVVESTCAASGAHLAVAANAASALTVQRRTCGQSAENAGRSYTRRVVRVDAAVVGDDRLLAYLAGETAPALPLWMVVHTYE